MIQLGPVRIRNLAELQVPREKYRGQYRLNNCNIPVMEDPGKWILDRSKGMYLVRITALDAAGEQIDHLVIVHADKGIIIDPIERNALSNRLGVLEACFGGECGSFEMPEVHQLECQHIGK